MPKPSPRWLRKTIYPGSDYETSFERKERRETTTPDNQDYQHLRYGKDGNVNALFALYVAELFVIAAMWHNKPARSGMERESERPDPAVLFSRRIPNLRKQALSVQVQTTVEQPQSKQQMKESTV
jgi:hypothetical protein